MIHASAVVPWSALRSNLLSRSALSLLLGRGGGAGLPFSTSWGRSLLSGVEESEPLVGEREVAGPGPVLREAEEHLPGPVDEAAGGVEEPVAEAAWLGSGEVPVEADVLAPGEEVGGGKDELHPGGVGGERSERHAFEPAVFEVADPVLDLGVAPVSQLDVDEVTFAVGEHDLVAEPVVVPEAQLGAGVGLLPPTDRPGARRPRVERDLELDDLGAAPNLTVGVPGGDPRVGPDSGDRCVQRGGDAPADGELAVAGDEPVDEPADRASGISPHQHRVDDRAGRVAGVVPRTPGGRELGDGVIDHQELVCAGVRGCVAGTEVPSERSPVASRKQNIGWNPNPRL